MKKATYIFAVITILFVWSTVANAQCDRRVQGAIHCGYYDAGYQDGGNDARSNRTNDYRRYRNKFDIPNESFYRAGYESGYAAVNAQNYPDYRTTGTGGNNTATWSGRVDNVGQVIIQGNNIRAQNISGSVMDTTFQRVNGSLPRRAATVYVNKTDGRGTVSVIQQPTRANDYTAIIQINDPKGGADNYKLDISWQATTTRDEPYQSGRAIWRGRVDQTTNIIVSGNGITTQSVAGRPTTSEYANVSGYLSRRAGTVRVRKTNGRGSVYVLEQPTYQNDFSAVIQINDPKGGDDYYEIEITW
jgi:hypothetical protein